MINDLNFETIGRVIKTDRHFTEINDKEYGGIALRTRGVPFVPILIKDDMVDEILCTCLIGDLVAVSGTIHYAYNNIWFCLNEYLVVDKAPDLHSFVKDFRDVEYEENPTKVGENLREKGDED